MCTYAEVFDGVEFWFCQLIFIRNYPFIVTFYPTEINNNNNNNNNPIQNDAKNLKNDWNSATWVLIEIYPMNTNMTGFRCFSKSGLDVNIWNHLPCRAGDLELLPALKNFHLPWKKKSLADFLGFVSNIFSISYLFICSFLLKNKIFSIINLILIKGLQIYNSRQYSSAQACKTSLFTSWNSFANAC